MTTHPTALADQLQAATADANRAMRAAATGDITLSRSRPPRWLAEQFAALTRALTYGTAQLCPHIGPAPRVVHAAAWAPGRLVCTGCIRLLRPTPAQDGTCDRCQRQCRRVHAGAVAFGPVLLGYGLCTACHTATNQHRQ